MIAIAVLFTFGLKFFAPMDILWRKIMPNIRTNRRNIVETTFRASCVLILGCVAVAVPLIDPFISLIGSILTSFLSRSIYEQQICQYIN